MEDEHSELAARVARERGRVRPFASRWSGRLPVPRRMERHTAGIRSAWSPLVGTISGLAAAGGSARGTGHESW